MTAGAYRKKTIAAVDGPVHDFGPVAAGACEDFYCLGYGLTYPIALEGALKLSREVTYAHCGITSTEFKHGPFRRWTRGSPSFSWADRRTVGLLVSGIQRGVPAAVPRPSVIAQESSEAEGPTPITAPSSPPRPTPSRRPS